VNARAPAAAPLVSILLASRNGARYLPEALRGVEAQTYRPIEIIAVDDGSTDETGRILSAFASSHPNVLVERAEGIGPAAARDLAFRRSNGSLIAIHDDDDVSRPERFARQVATFERNPALGVLGSLADVIDERGERVGPFPVPLAPEAIRKTLRRAPPFVNSSVMMRRSAYVAAGGYRGAFLAAEDYDLWLRVPREFELANLAEPLYSWRRHVDSTTARDRTRMIFFAAVARAFADERRATGHDSIERLAAHPDPAAFLDQYALAGRLAVHFGEALAREGRAKEARQYLGRALHERGGLLRAGPWWLLTWLLPLTPRGRAAGRAQAAAARRRSA